MKKSLILIAVIGLAVTLTFIGDVQSTTFTIRPPSTSVTQQSSIQPYAHARLGKIKAYPTCKRSSYNSHG